MFITTKLQDNVRVEPADLGRPLAEAVTSCLKRSLINKIIPDIGLVVTLYDLLDVQGGHIYPSDGAAHYEVTFRVLVFRPWVGEIIVGRLLSSDQRGLRMSLDFFDDIHISSDALPDPSFFEKQAGEEDKVQPKGRWHWLYEGNRMDFDMDEHIRFRVQEVVFTRPPTAVAQLQASGDGEPPPGSAANPFAVMQVNASVKEEGLGLELWWDQPADDMDELS
ncbi:hypothetical protein WJX81_000629 [Elliptochloris bilobata]|uniref:Uncharacterized protein n=1 Tax=Elliptochloris bilobata TaxID=381761 RepID=A0AAW1RUC6_9CHLO